MLRTVIFLIAMLVPACGASDGIQVAGDVLQIALPVTAGGFTLFQRDGPGAWQLTESLALTLGTTYALKYTIDETRPNGMPHSFPSGHTSISFCAAEFMRKRYGWWCGGPAYLTAAFVGYSRVESHEHWVHDVFAGAAIGFASSYLITSPYENVQMNIEGDSKHVAFNLSFRF